MVNLGNIFSFGAPPGSGGGSSLSGSGITRINNQIGPSITIVGVNGITVSANGNTIVINGASLSGVSSGGGTGLGSFVQSFTGITSGLFAHNFNTRSVLVQVFDDSAPPRRIEPDETILTSDNETTLLFNKNQSGFIVVHGPSGSQSSSSTTKFAQSFTNITSGIFTHNLNTEDVLVQIYDDRNPRRQIIAEDILITSSNQVSVLFARQQTGRIVII